MLYTLLPPESRKVLLSCGSICRVLETTTQIQRRQKVQASKMLCPSAQEEYIKDYFRLEFGNLIKMVCKYSPYYGGTLSIDILAQLYADLLFGGADGGSK